MFFLATKVTVLGLHAPSYCLCSFLHTDPHSATIQVSKASSQTLNTTSLPTLQQTY